MIRLLCRPTLFIVCGLALWACANPCRAHFLWIKTITHEGRPHAFLFFGENALDEAYHLPQALADSKLWRRTADGKSSQLPAQPLEADDRIGLVAPLDENDSCILQASEQYGVYGTALLVYSAKHINADSIDKFNAAGASKELALDIVPRIDGKQLELTIFWEGKPLPDVEVSVAVDHAEPVKNTTDKNGRVALDPEGHGIVSVLASRMNKDLTGELAGKKYDHGLHYASLTFVWPPAQKSNAGDRSAAKPPALPPLPEPLSSFGAAVCDGWLYVYGGHTGTEHEHSAANLSNHFQRLNLSGGGAQWEELPMQTPLQGLALVAYNGKIYRIGGVNARNATIDEQENLHSTAEFAEYDPQANHWTALAPLPAPRSSHNAVVIGDRLYVVGGWALSGSSPGEWQEDAIVYDFSDPSNGWRQLPKPPFTRRALAAAHWNGKLMAIGGLNEAGEVAQSCDFFDPLTGDWSDGPKLPGDGHAGFGASAWTLEGELFASGLSGILFRLSDDGSQWKQVGRLEKPRFFHQLVAAPNGRALLAVGGASRNGHLADIEWIDVGN